MDFRIHLHPEVTQTHTLLLQTYLRGTERLSRQEWRNLRIAVAYLAQSRLEFQGQTYTFVQFYRNFVEAAHAPTFLVELYQTQNIQPEGMALQAQHARAILTWLTTNGFYGPNAGAASFLVVYCLYQWASFAGGYLFQVTLFRDLETHGIQFTPNDPRNPQERFADHDLLWQGFRGDIKQSLYFLDALPQRSLTADFYLTQMYDQRTRSQRRIALMHERMWQRINGQTIPDRLTDALQWFPNPVSLMLQQETWVVMEYEAWKSYILRVQTRGEQ